MGDTWRKMTSINKWRLTCTNRPAHTNVMCNRVTLRIDAAKLIVCSHTEDVHKPCIEGVYVEVATSDLVQPIFHWVHPVQL